MVRKESSTLEHRPSISIDNRNGDCSLDSRQRTDTTTIALLDSTSSSSKSVRERWKQSPLERTLRPDTPTSVLLPTLRVPYPWRLSSRAQSRAIRFELLPCRRLSFQQLSLYPFRRASRCSSLNERLALWSLPLILGAPMTVKTGALPPHNEP